MKNDLRLPTNPAGTRSEEPSRRTVSYIGSLNEGTGLGAGSDFSTSSAEPRSLADVSCVSPADNLTKLHDPPGILGSACERGSAMKSSDHKELVPYRARNLCSIDAPHFGAD